MIHVTRMVLGSKRTVKNFWVREQHTVAPWTLQTLTGANHTRNHGGATTTGPDATHPPTIFQNLGGGGGQLGGVQPGVTGWEVFLPGVGGGGLAGCHGGGLAGGHGGVQPGVKGGGG